MIFSQEAVKYRRRYRQIYHQNLKKDDERKKVTRAEVYVV